MKTDRCLIPYVIAGIAAACMAAVAGPVWRTSNMPASRAIGKQPPHLLDKLIEKDRTDSNTHYIHANVCGDAIPAFQVLSRAVVETGCDYTWDTGRRLESSLLANHPTAGSYILSFATHL